MQEIYAGAKQMVVWLGPSTSYSFVAMAFIRELVKSFDSKWDILDESVDLRQSLFSHLKGLTKLLKDAEDGNQETWRALADLFLTPWRGRVWVVQELASASSATFIWGDSSIQWHYLALVIRLPSTWHLSLVYLEGLEPIYNVFPNTLYIKRRMFLKLGGPFNQEVLATSNMWSTWSVAGLVKIPGIKSI
jgi:hypothetical protein